MRAAAVANSVARAGKHGFANVLRMQMERLPPPDIHANEDEALQLAAAHGHRKVVRMLVREYGAHVSARNDLALWTAAYQGHLGVIRLLVAHGANIRAVGPLHLAVRKGHYEIVRWLVENGGDPNGTVQWLSGGEQFETCCLLVESSCGSDDLASAAKKFFKVFETVQFLMYHGVADHADEEETRLLADVATSNDRNQFY